MNIKGKLSKLEHKVVIYYGGDFNNSQDITDVISQSSQEGIKLENNKIALNVKLIYRNGTHQFVNSTNNNLKFSIRDIIRVFVKYTDGTPIDITKRDDVLQEYFLKSWSVSPQSQMVSLNATDIVYRIMNRLWSGNWGARLSGTSTSITNNVLTDTTANFIVDKWINRTLQLEDVNGNIFTYLITSNTATTITVHKNIDPTVTTAYLVGDSSPYVLNNAIKLTTHDPNYRGLYAVGVLFTTKYGSDYNTGIQLLRPDNSAFPIIDYAQDRKPYFTLINELGAVNAVNTESEIRNQGNVIIRDMIFSTRWNTEIQKYQIDWFYSAHPILLDKGTINSNTTTTITDLTKAWTVDAYINKLVRINSKTFQVISNTSNTLTFNTVSLNDIVTTNTVYTILGNVDFVWDSPTDYRQILDYNLGNNEEPVFNHILYNCGKNELTGTDVIGHSYNVNSIWVIKDTYIPMTWIIKRIVKDSNTWSSSLTTPNPIIDTKGKWQYPSYPYTFTNINGKTLTNAIVVNNNTEFNNNLDKICRFLADRFALNIFQGVKEGVLRGNFRIRGNKFFKSGNQLSVAKYYNKGTTILFRDLKNGFNNPKQVNGYYALKVLSITHEITPTSWETRLKVEYDYYSQIEYQSNLQ